MDATLKRQPNGTSSRRRRSKCIHRGHAGALRFMLYRRVMPSAKL